MMEYQLKKKKGTLEAFLNDLTYATKSNNEEGIIDPTKKIPGEKPQASSMESNDEEWIIDATKKIPGEKPQASSMESNDEEWIIDASKKIPGEKPQASSMESNDEEGIIDPIKKIPGEKSIVLNHHFAQFGDNLTSNDDKSISVENSSPTIRTNLCGELQQNDNNKDCHHTESNSSDDISPPLISQRKYRNAKYKQKSNNGSKTNAAIQFEHPRNTQSGLEKLSKQKLNSSSKVSKSDTNFTQKFPSTQSSCQDTTTSFRNLLSKRSSLKRKYCSSSSDDDDDLLSQGNCKVETRSKDGSSLLFEKSFDDNYSPSEELFSSGSEYLPSPINQSIVMDSCSSDESDVFPEISSLKQKAEYRTKINAKVASMNSKESSDEDETLNEDEILRALDTPKIYVRKILQNYTSKTGKKKKNPRVCNSYQYCDLCKIKVSNFSQHMSRNRNLPSHANSTELCNMLNEDDKQKAAVLRTLLRAKFNHSYNQNTLKNGHGELLLERRPQKDFKVSDYGPCPGCLLWLSLDVMRKHKDSCPNRQNLSKGMSLITQSDVITKRVSPSASDLLIKEVYSIMKRDLVGITAREDGLITLLGNQWLQKNIGNRLMRGSYTSQIMRLCSRLLINLREIEPIDGDLWDYLKPKYFETIVKATLQIADFIDDENLGKPSNARKLGFDVKRLINAKIGTSILNGDNESRTEASDLLRSVEIFWGTRVAKLSNVNLEERRYNKHKELPKPSDIEKLNLYLEKQITSLDLENTSFENFIKVAELIAAKLVSYNRRRSGELEAIRLIDFVNRNKEISPEHLVGELSEFERKLLESQEVVTVRGKVGRGVPVIIPEITKAGLGFLTNESVRKAANITESNPYVFASRGKGVVRAYDALSKASHNAGLERPELVTSTSLRKYMATITQVLGLKPNEMEWVIDHLGHSMDIHKIHYRSTSDILSKSQISKLLMIQDMGKVGSYKNMSLNDIQMEDVVFGNDKEILSSDIFDVAENLSEDGDDSEPILKKKKKITTCNSKSKWSEEEEKEIQTLFSKYIAEKRRPTPKQCVKAMMMSKKNGGLIHKRKKDVLKKKMFRIIDKLKK